MSYTYDRVMEGKGKSCQLVSLQDDYIRHNSQFKKELPTLSKKIAPSKGEPPETIQAKHDLLAKIWLENEHAIEMRKLMKAMWELKAEPGEVTIAGENSCPAKTP